MGRAAFDDFLQRIPVLESWGGTAMLTRISCAGVVWVGFLRSRVTYFSFVDWLVLTAYWLAAGLHVLKAERWEREVGLSRANLNHRLPISAAVMGVVGRSP